MANTFNWQLGHEGKGNVYPGGEISTWNTGEYAFPHHGEKAAEDELGQPAFKFYITPEGGLHDGNLGFENRSPSSDDKMIQEIVAQHPAIWDGRNSEDMYRYEAPERTEYGHAYNLLASKLANSGWADFHTEFKIPRGVRKQIRRWVDRLKWPEGSEKMDAREYHITVLDMDTYDEDFAKWAKKRVEGKTLVFKSQSMDLFNEFVVVRLECPVWDELAKDWTEEAEKRGLEPHTFPGGPKAHISVGKSPNKKWPQGIPNPHVKFETRMFNIKKNSMAWPLDVYHVSPASNREAIEQEGLRSQESSFPMYNPTNMGRGIPGNYAFDNPEDAERYAMAHAQMRNHPMDIYRVNPAGLQIEQDPESFYIRPRNSPHELTEEGVAPHSFEPAEEIEETHSPNYYWYRPKPEDYEGSDRDWEEDEESMDWYPTMPTAWRIKDHVPPQNLTHHKTITPEYVNNLPVDSTEVAYNDQLPWRQAPEPVHNIQWESPQAYQNAVNQFLKVHGAETTPAEDLKSWLDSFTPKPTQPPSLHHTDGDDFTPQIVAPVVQTPHVDPPSKPYKPYNWAEEGWEESPMDRIAAISEGKRSGYHIDVEDDGENHLHVTAHHPETGVVGGFNLNHWYPGEAKPTGYPQDVPNHYWQIDNEIEVDPEYQRQGIASDMWDELENYIRQTYPNDQHTIDHGGFSPEGSEWWRGYKGYEREGNGIHYAAIDTHICPKCGEESNSPICATCGHDPQNSPDDYQQMKNDWYDRAWSVPGNQPRPVPNQPMHWRDDHAKNVSLAHTNQDNFKESGGWHGF